MSAPMELRACRGPHCQYKAPVCAYGYCAACCRKHHTYAIMGIVNHKVPTLEPVTYGFKVVEKGAITTGVTSLVPIITRELQKPPECGTLEVVENLEYPIEDSGNAFYRTI